MKMNFPDPSLQITTLLTIVERLTSRDTLFRHRLHTVTTENNLHGFVRQTQILKFWSYLVAEVRELEVVTGRDGSAAAATQKTDKQGLSAVGIDCEFLKNDLGCRQGSLCSYKHAKMLATRGKCYNCGPLGHRACECSRPKNKRDEGQKREPQNPRTSQTLKMPAEYDGENVKDRGSNCS